MTSAPRNLAGAHSDVYIGMVALLSPIPTPSKILKPTIIRQFREKACDRQEIMENRQVSRIVPRRPNIAFKGWVSLSYMSDRDAICWVVNLPATKYAAEVRSAGNEAYTRLVASDTECVNIECLRCK